jgi:chemotaxis protein histidine kinase CheA
LRFVVLASRDTPAHDLPRFLGIFEQVCQTMAYAHARGVIHRDLKPSNIMVGAFGEVQVMDWGLAKVLTQGGTTDELQAAEPAMSVIQTVRSGSEADASHTGEALGTPAYMAPEQAGGDVAAIDERADVFGLGSILCEVLTGRPAYTGPSSDAILRKALRGDTAEALRRLDACRAEAELVLLARHCLAAEAEERPRDAGEVIRRLTAYQDGVQGRLRAAELARAAEQARAEEAQATAAAAERARAAEEARAEEARAAAAKQKRLGRRFLVAAVVAGMLAVGLVGLAIWANKANHESQIAAEKATKSENKAIENLTIAVAETNRADQAARLAQTNEEKAKAQARIATSRQLAALSVAARNKRLDRSLLLAIEALLTQNTLESLDSLYRALQSQPGITSFLHINRGSVQSVAFSPDANILAAVNGGEFGRGSGVVLWDVAGRKRVREHLLTDIKGSHMGVAALSPDASTLAAGYLGSGVVLWDVARGKRLVEGPLAVPEG